MSTAEQAIMTELFPESPGEAVLLGGAERAVARQTIRRCHYTHSVPSCKKSYYFRFDEAIVLFGIPPNMNIAAFLFGREADVWELSRLWAPDGHPPNLLTQAVSRCIAAFRRYEPTCEAIVSYADPNVGHSGGIYRAASFLFTGQSDETRYYLGPHEEIKARRGFRHHGITKAEIEASGFTEHRRPGKLRFVKGLTPKARRELARRWQP
jgi:hypothetical protein